MITPKYGIANNVWHDRWCFLADRGKWGAVLQPICLLSTEHNVAYRYCAYVDILGFGELIEQLDARRSRRIRPGMPYRQSAQRSRR
jgi:hypothetical protein